MRIAVGSSRAAKIAAVYSAAARVASIEPIWDGASINGFNVRTDVPASAMGHVERERRRRLSLYAIHQVPTADAVAMRKV